MLFPLILLAVSLITHLVFFGHPASVVFDEVYNGGFLRDYATHSFYFDVHPPLGKLVVEGFGHLIGTTYNADFGAIGNSLPWDVILLRLVPIAAGILLPIVVYYICRHLNMSKLASFAAGLLLCFENSLIVQSRCILFDGLMLLFGFSAILLYQIYVKKGSGKILLIGSALLCAAAFSIKWTGLAFPLLICIIEIIRIKKFKSILKFFAVYAVIGIVFYMSIFAINFSLLTHSGPGDDFVTDRFQKTLEGNVNTADVSLRPKGFFGKFLELNYKMYEGNQQLTIPHQYSSMWYTWPLMLRPIFYWESTAEAGNASPHSYIYYLGNPLLYWFGTLSILILLYRFLRKRDIYSASLVILLGFLVNFVPFIFIGRIMFLYHYEAALVFSIMAIAWIVDKFPRKNLSFGILLALCLCVFIYFSPLTYGFPLADTQLAHRMWLSSWR